MNRTLLPCCLLAGCASDPFDTFMVDQAWLSSDTSSQGMFAFVGGYNLGDAELVVRDTDGYTWAIPVELSGSLWGVGADFGLGIYVEPTITLRASERSLSEVLGDYSGSHVVFDGVIGFAQLDVENAAGCQISAFSFDLGVGFLAGGALLNLHSTGDPRQTDEPVASD